MKIIELKNISKKYILGKIDIPVLHNISLSIDEGEFIAIMGPSGSGKSTLLHILGLLDKPTSGQYFLCNKETSKLNDEEIASLRNRFIGFVFQQFNLLPKMRAIENVMLPLVYSENHKKTLKDAQTLLNKVGLLERSNHKPNELSGGQQQRVAIARALINDPLVIFADEPTGNLDSRSAEEIIKILKNLNDSGITIIMVTHEPDLASCAKRIIKLHDGLIISDEKLTKQKSETNKQICLSTYNKDHLFGIKKLKDYFLQAFRSLLSNKTRSILSILGVLIGVSSVIAMLALGTGAQEDVKKRISSLGSNLLFVRPGSFRVGGIAIESGVVTRFTLDDVQKIKELQEVNAVVPYVSGRAQVVFENKNWNTRIEGVSEEYPIVRNVNVSIGRFFNALENQTRAKVAVIGQTVLNNLFKETNPIGEFIKINRIDFMVIGVFEKRGSSGFRDDDDIVQIPLNTAMYRLLGKEYIDNMDVQVKQADLMETVSEKIKNIIISTHRLRNDANDVVNIRNMADIQETINATTKTFAYLLGSIAFISLLVGGIGIMNIMLVSVTERTREIGIRKAIGANNKDIMFQFIIESMVICLLGGFFGILLGSGISFSLAKFAGWSTKISIFSVLLALLFSLFTGLIFGLWPARKASLLHPIEALRYE